MRDDGLNMVETYVFWNLHEPSQLRGSLQYNFEGYANLTLFLEKAAKAGLFVNLRIGPYVCAEWNWGKTPSLLPSASVQSPPPIVLPPLNIDMPLL